MKEGFQKIPISALIYIDIDDEVASIYEKIKSKKNDEAFIVVPENSVLSESIINLKILKRKAADLDKKLTIFTKDKTTIIFSHQCKIPVFENFTSKEEANPDEIEESRPKKADKSKVTIAEVTAKIKYIGLLEKFKTGVDGFLRRKTKQKQTRTLTLRNPNRSLMASLITGSVIVLLLIAYIALPNATVKLKPNSIPIEQAANIILADSVVNAELLKTAPVRTIPSFIISPGMIEKTVVFNATGSDSTGVVARGVLLITNKTDNELALKPTTRFQTDDGLIFRSQGYVAVPALGEASVAVVADEVDLDGVPIGDRGNLVAPAKLFLPGLKDIRRELFYATVKEALTGGVTSKNRIVTQRDIDASKEFAKKELIQSVPKLMEDYLITYNREKNMNLTLLNDPQAIKLEDPEIILDESILGKVMDTFTLTVRVKATGIAFEKALLLDILKKQLSNSKSPDKSISTIDEKGVTYRVFKSEPEKGTIEITATITGIERYDLDPNSESGARFIEKIKSHIAGLEISDAKKYIENLSEIETADVLPWPFWAPTVPSNPENINVTIDERAQ